VVATDIAATGHGAHARREREEDREMIELAHWMRSLMHPRLSAGPAGPQSPRFHLTSPEIRDGGTVPMRHVYGGCGGEDLSPELTWHNPPPGTRSFAVTCYDPDAPTGSGWWHWQIYDIPGNQTALAAGAGNASGTRPAPALQSRNDYGEVGYGGPCPPPGDKPHRYIFTVHALKVGRLDVKADSSCAMIGFMLNANRIDRASLTATYGR
jgi:Raf kinase inhibitor-like YbhB/YbcL family protein